MVNMKKGQYMAAKFRGFGNGDVIVGRVESVRVGGTTLLANLITGKTSVKKTRVLAARNHRVTKVQADALVKVARVEGNQAARQQAVDLWRLTATRATHVTCCTHCGQPLPARVV